MVEGNEWLRRSRKDEIREVRQKERDGDAETSDEMQRSDRVEDGVVVGWHHRENTEHEANQEKKEHARSFCTANTGALK